MTDEPVASVVHRLRELSERGGVVDDESQGVLTEPVFVERYLHNVVRRMNVDAYKIILIYVCVLIGPQITHGIFSSFWGIFKLLMATSTRDLKLSIPLGQVRRPGRRQLGRQLRDLRPPPC